MENDRREQRRHERVRIPYVLKFRSLKPGAKNWDAVTPLNMSETGIRFFTVEQFLPGSEMFLLVTNPMIEEERTYDCKVLRSEKMHDHAKFFETVVTIENMDREAKEAYQKMLESFRSKKKDIDR